MAPGARIRCTVNDPVGDLCRVAIVREDGATLATPCTQSKLDMVEVPLTLDLCKQK